MSLFADQGREQLRDVYREAWRKWRAGVPLQPLEVQLVDVIGQHPEYHARLEADSGVASEFAAEEPNPFLHLSLHVALREQIGTDRPRGISAIHRRLARRLGSEHAAEHRMLEPLAGILWEAQRAGRAPDEAAYWERLQGLL